MAPAHRRGLDRAPASYPPKLGLVVFLVVVELRKEHVGQLPKAFLAQSGVLGLQHFLHEFCAVKLLTLVWVLSNDRGHKLSRRHLSNLPKGCGRRCAACGMAAAPPSNRPTTKIRPQIGAGLPTVWPIGAAARA